MARCGLPPPRCEASRRSQAAPSSNARPPAIATAASRRRRIPSWPPARAVSPVVSLLADELRRAVLAVAGRRPMRSLAPWPEGHRWAALVTHDLDVVEWWALFPMLRMAELGRKGDWNLFARVARAARRSLGPGSSHPGRAFTAPARGPLRHPRDLVRDLRPAHPPVDGGRRLDLPARRSACPPHSHRAHSCWSRSRPARQLRHREDAESMMRSAARCVVSQTPRSTALASTSSGCARDGPSAPWWRPASSTTPPGALPTATAFGWAWPTWSRPGMPSRGHS